MIELGTSFDTAIDRHRTIMEVEMAHNLHRDYEQGRDQFSAQLRQLIERGREYKAIDYTRAVAGIDPLNAALAAVFDEFDAILTPAAPGEAPRGLASTGNPVFCTTWTYLGVPAVTLPLLRSAAGLPLGVQLVGRRGNDARLLRSARWLVKTLGRGTLRRGTLRRGILGRGARRRAGKSAATAKAGEPRRRKGKAP
jgi:Asp-tRNA(Asn)/Glu-tRNA(Gln) amidotransferase A subunit family amidase